MLSTKTRLRNLLPLMLFAIAAPTARAQPAAERHLYDACNLLRDYAYSPGHAVRVTKLRGTTRENYHQRFLSMLPWQVFTTNIAASFPEPIGEADSVAAATARALRELPFPNQESGPFNELAEGFWAERLKAFPDENFLKPEFRGPQIYSLLVVEYVVAPFSEFEGGGDNLRQEIEKRLQELPQRAGSAAELKATDGNNSAYSFVNFLSLPPGSRVHSRRVGFLSSWFGYSEIPGFTPNFRWMRKGTYDFQCVQFFKTLGMLDAVPISKLYETVDFGRLY